MKIASWNIEGRLTRFTKTGRGSPEHILATIKSLNADVLFLAEASDDDVIESAVADELIDFGYKIHTVPYEDMRDRKWAAEKAPNMKFLSKVAVQNFRRIRLGDIRNSLFADIVEPKSQKVIRIFGIHLDDRSEEGRMAQMADLVPLITSSPYPTIVMGDYNAMHAKSVPARILRAQCTQILFGALPRVRMGYVLTRLSNMAIGSTLATLEGQTGLIDADPKFHNTSTPKMRYQEWLPSIRMVQIDHMFVSKEIKISNFKVSRDGGSDHRAISANIEVDIDKK